VGTYGVLEFRVGAALDEGVCKAENASELLVAVGEVHGGEPCECLVLRVHCWDGEVCAQFQCALLGFVVKGAEVCGTTNELSALELDRHGEDI
jgi:hypothetical protein